MKFAPKFAPSWRGVGQRIPASFQDGTSRTIFVVETRPAVPWTKPEDVRYDPKKKLPKLGGVYKDGFYVGMVDGSTHFVSATVSEATLRAAITRNAGDILGDDWDSPKKAPKEK
jgi:hypothetical protein